MPVRLMLPVLLTAGVSAGSQVQTTTDDSPLVRGTVAFTLADRALIPESVAYDPVDRAFYVGSMYKRKIIRIGADGSVSDFLPPGRDGIWGVLGIKVDSVR